ncbi:hypothetical protein IPP75_03775 [Candidatus Saccharibacteria bacterium]|nr:MAG: hypothetical protein IPP75_03775 [Candidatus Saccharibacteria bacterium]
MSKVYTIYEAKTHLSKLGKRAAAGETIYVGAYGTAQFMLTPIHVAKTPQKSFRKIGVWDHKAIPDAYDYASLVGPDTELNALIEESIDRPFPGTT